MAPSDVARELRLPSFRRPRRPRRHRRKSSQGGPSSWSRWHSAVSSSPWRAQTRRSQRKAPTPSFARYAQRPSTATAASGPSGCKSAWRRWRCEQPFGAGRRQPSRLAALSSSDTVGACCAPEASPQRRLRDALTRLNGWTASCCSLGQMRSVSYSLRRMSPPAFNSRTVPRTVSPSLLSSHPHLRTATILGFTPTASLQYLNALSLSRSLHHNHSRLVYTYKDDLPLHRDDAILASGQAICSRRSRPHKSTSPASILLRTLQDGFQEVQASRREAAKIADDLMKEQVRHHRAVEGDTYTPNKRVLEVENECWRQDKEARRRRTQSAKRPAACRWRRGDARRSQGSNSKANSQARLSRRCYQETARRRLGRRRPQTRWRRPKMA